jgi:ribosomal protein S18 acetylase RimI-like enzyme
VRLIPVSGPSSGSQDRNLLNYGVAGEGSGVLPLPGAAGVQGWVESRGMSVQIEPVKQTTAEVVDAVRRLLPQLSQSALPPDPERLARVVDCPTNTVLVARSGGVIVGMLTLVLLPIPSGLRARIEDVVVDEVARGQGVGDALSRAALELAASQGAKTVDLTSRPSRAAANRLYERLGFVRRESVVYRFTIDQPWAGGSG